MKLKLNLQRQVLQNMNDIADLKISTTNIESDIESLSERTSINETDILDLSIRTLKRSVLPGAPKIVSLAADGSQANLYLGANLSIANGTLEVENPFTTGAGQDSAVLIATPTPEDPSVNRTNTVTGDFSAVLAGSRNDISATESGAVGGIVHIYGGGNDFGTGYRQTLQDCENSISNGYRNTLTYCSQVAAFGRGLTIMNCSNSIFAGYNIEALGSENAKLEANALFGYDISSTASYGLSVGMHNVLSNNVSATIGDHLITSRYAQTNIGQYNKANNQAYFVVGSGQSETARKNCFAAGWDGNGTTEEDRKVIWVGDTKVSENNIIPLTSFKKYSLAAATTSYIIKNSFSASDWNRYGAYNHLEMWSGSNYQTTQPAGSLFMLTGISTDTNERYVIVAQSLGVNPSNSTDTRAYGRSIFCTHGAEAVYMFNNLSTNIFN